MRNDDPEGLQEVYNQFDVEDDQDYRFKRISDHYVKKGVLILKTNYTDDDDQYTTIEVTFSLLKKDVRL